MKDEKETSICVGCFGEKGKEQVCPYCCYDEGNLQTHPSHLPSRVVLNEKYMVGKVLGQGGFGVTYIGFDLVLHKKIAIKEYFPSSLVARSGSEVTVIPHLDQITNFRNGLEKFIDEARNLSRFTTNQNIVNVLDYFERNGTAYIVMDYLEGDNLVHFLKKNGNILSVDHAVDKILRPILKALKKMHSSNIYHRDISPQNIILAKESLAPILIDFGAARQITGEQSRSLDIVLKPGYSPFESYTSAGNIGPWTDIYSCGAVLYLILTGKTPPSSSDRILKDNLVQPKEVGAIKSHITEGLNDAILRMLAVRKEDRFQSVDELEKALDEKEENYDLPKTKSGKPWLKISLIVLVFAVTATIFSLLGDKPVSDEPVVGEPVVDEPKMEELGISEKEEVGTREVVVDNEVRELAGVLAQDKSIDSKGLGSLLVIADGANGTSGRIEPLSTSFPPGASTNNSVTQVSFANAKGDVSVDFGYVAAGEKKKPVSIEFFSPSVHDLSHLECARVENLNKKIIMSDLTFDSLFEFVEITSSTTAKKGKIVINIPPEPGSFGLVTGQYRGSLVCTNNIDNKEIQIDFGFYLSL